MPNEKDTWNTRTGNELWWIMEGTEGREITQTTKTFHTTKTTLCTRTTQSTLSTRTHTTQSTRSTRTYRLETQAPQYKQLAKHKTQHRQEERVVGGSRWNVHSFVYVTLYARFASL